MARAWLRAISAQAEVVSTAAEQSIATGVRQSLRSAVIVVRGDFA